MTSRRDIPAIEELARDEALAREVAAVPRPIAVEVIRRAVDRIKQNWETKKDRLTMAQLRTAIRRELVKAKRREITRVINATGIAVHTNLGRAPLASELFEAVRETVTGYGNIEFDLTTGRRGSRGVACEHYLALLSGAEAATVVNNNAAALFLILNTFANRRPAVVSRGELVQIGGGFRIPDIMRRSGARIREVGTTNITSLADYEEALTERTGLILKVHQSNFRQEGFTGEVDVKELAELGRRHDTLVLNDLGSGVLIDTKGLTGHSEPTVQQSVRAGADLTCFSGDKLLGGSQAGLIVGRAELVKKIKRNPLFRTMRVDKIVFAMLERLCRLYLEGEHTASVRLWSLLQVSEKELYQRAKTILAELGHPDGLSVEATDGYVGGGSLPEAAIPSVALCFAPGHKASRLEKAFRETTPPIIGRIEQDRFYLDVRTLLESDLPCVVAAVREILKLN